jgi:hypothetical protein
VTDAKSFDLNAVVKSTFDKALELQQPLAEANVARLRRVNPDKSPAQLIKYANAIYLTAVTTTGGAAGASAAVPNGVVQIPVAIADLLTFLEASVLYTLTVAEIHGLHIEDLERRRFLVMAVLLGDAGATRVISPLVQRTAPHWGKQVVKAIPMTAINAANKVLGPRFITKYGTTQGLLVLAKQVPFFIGAGIGAAGNHLFGWVVIKASKKILGPVRDSWDAPVLGETLPQ